MFAGSEKSLRRMPVDENHQFEIGEALSQAIQVRGTAAKRVVQKPFFGKPLLLGT
jgi:hypothetical protein